MKALHDFLPQAQGKDWHLANAGQRVQIIKKCDKNWGKLEFGTELVTSNDGSLATLLGASPGASVSVQAMIHLLERCFEGRMKDVVWQKKMQQLVPSYGESLIENADLLHQVRDRTLKTLKLV